MTRILSHGQRAIFKQMCDVTIGSVGGFNQAFMEIAAAGHTHLIGVCPRSRSLRTAADRPTRSTQRD